MTTITYSHSHRSVFLHPVGALSSAATAIAHAWKQHRDARALEGLPFETMKDIGYRAAGDEKTGNAER